MRFLNYINGYTRRNRILSEDDILGMTLEKIFDKEPAILAQNSQIGIPSYDELNNSPNAKWIAPFTNAQGESDGGYWESNIQLNNILPQDSIQLPQNVSLHPNIQETDSDGSINNEWNYEIIDGNPTIKAGISMDVEKNPYDVIQDDKNLSIAEKILKIKELSESRNKEIDKENVKALSKIWGGAALQILSAFIPELRIQGLEKIGAPLIPKIGRKLSEEIAKGTTKGAMSGALYGLGEGVQKEKNIAENVIKDTVAGASGGALLSSAGANIEKAVSGNALYKYGHVDLLPEKLRKEYFKNSKKYYQNYVQGIQLEKDGKIINFSKKGLQEVLRWNPEFAKKFSNLIKDIKKSKKLPNEKNFDSDKQFTKYFERYMGKDGVHIINVYEDGKRSYHFTRNSVDGVHHR